MIRSPQNAGDIKKVIRPTLIVRESIGGAGPADPVTPPR
jgi:hypothetical protein